MTDGAEPFELVRMLGTGHFATTYQARVPDEDVQARLGAGVVALKIPNSRRRQRFLVDEIAPIHRRAAPQLQSSTDLVHYLSIEEFRGTPVFVAEFGSPVSLRRVLDLFDRVSVDSAVNVGIGIVRGLEALHGAEVIHGAVSPENVLLEGIDRASDFVGRDVRVSAKLCDYAHTEPIEKLEHPFVRLCYSAPEVILGSPSASPGHDLWAAAAILYEMIAGFPPFYGRRHLPRAHGGDAVALVKNVSDGLFLSPRLANNDVSPELSDVIARALSPDPAARFETAGELRRALEAAPVRAATKQCLLCRRTLESSKVCRECHSCPECCSENCVIGDLRAEGILPPLEP